MRRSYALQTRATEQEARALDMIATHQNLSPSAALRWLIHEECQRCGMPIGLVNFYRELPDPVSPEVSNGQS
jgi:hypothetical protein